jgi:heterogeneous nuclear ribonucleoprotein A1/A3
MSTAEDNNNSKRKRTSDGPEENDDISGRHKRDLVERYVKAFPPEQLTNILIDIVAQVPDAFEMLESYASNEVSHRKIFLRGIGPDTSQSLIKDFFTQFGAIEKAEIVVDKNTGKNKGFAFLLFQDINSVNNALASESYEIDGKFVYVNLAVLGKQFIESQNKDNNQSLDDVDKRKLFIRNLNPSTTVEALKTYFSMHGEIESCNIVMDKVTKRSKNYGFVIYKNSASAARALKEKNHIIDGKAAVVVLASEGTTKPIDPFQQQQMMMAGYAFPGQQMVTQQIAAVPQGYVYAPSGQIGFAAAGQTQHFQQPQHQLRNAGTHYQPTLTSNQTQKW